MSTLHARRNWPEGVILGAADLKRSWGLQKRNSNKGRYMFGCLAYNILLYFLDMLFWVLPRMADT